MMKLIIYKENLTMKLDNIKTVLMKLTIFLTKQMNKINF
jgi:hypothetical protein